MTTAGGTGGTGAGAAARGANVCTGKRQCVHWVGTAPGYPGPVPARPCEPTRPGPLRPKGTRGDERASAGPARTWPVVLSGGEPRGPLRGRTWAW